MNYQQLCTTKYLVCMNRSLVGMYTAFMHDLQVKLIPRPCTIFAIIYYWE